MNIAIDTREFISLLAEDENPGGPRNKIRDFFLRIFRNKTIAWVLHRTQFEELVLKTRELIEEESLRGDDQENAKEFFGFLIDLQHMLVHGDPGACKIIFGNPVGVDTPDNRKAAVAGEIAGYITKLKSDWKREEIAATVVAFAMVEKADVFTGGTNGVVPMAAKLKELHAEAFPPFWVQRFRAYKEFPGVITHPKPKS